MIWNLLLYLCLSCGTNRQACTYQFILISLGNSHLTRWANCADKQVDW